MRRRGKSLLGVLAMGIKREMDVHVSEHVYASFKNEVEKFVVA